MIARLSGTLIEKAPGRAVVDVGGIGYEVTIPLSTYYELGEAGARVDLHIHTHVREETLALFGFRTHRERILFGRLIGVSGIGPRTAIAILSGLEIDEVVRAIRRRDGVRLASIPGIGRKTAERIVLDLADRLDALEGGGSPAGVMSQDGAAMRDDLISALVNLGYNAREAGEAAGRALKSRPPGSATSFPLLLRETLRVLSR